MVWRGKSGLSVEGLECQAKESETLGKGAVGVLTEAAFRKLAAVWQETEAELGSSGRPNEIMRWEQGEGMGRQEQQAGRGKSSPRT